MRILAAIFLVLSLACAAWAAEERPVQVDMFLRFAKVGDPPATVVGLVTSVQPDAKTFGIVDVRAAGCCATPADCAKMTALPVSFAGELPALNDRVRVRGVVKESGGKLFLAAETVKVEKTLKK